MEGKEILKKILPHKSAYKKTIHLIYSYKDLKNGEEINEEVSKTIKIIDKAIEYIKDDKYIDIILLTTQGKTVEQIEEILKLERATVYKHKKRLIKRISVILYGDKAL